MQHSNDPTRRCLLRAAAAFSTLALFPSAVRGQTQHRPSVGAIRWDAWYDPADGGVARAMERALAPERYHDRMPFFGQEIGPDNVRINGRTQATMDREIALASRAGLDYWAFVGYSPEDPMTNALNLYLSSAHRREIGFCMIGSVANGGSRGHMSDRTLHELALMQEAGYVKVLGGRPLYYLLSAPEAQLAAEWGGASGMAQLVAFLRSGAKSKGLGDPYIVLLGSDAALARATNCDAIGAYAIVGHSNKSPYRQLAAFAMTRWDEMARSGIAMVPTVMTGWDQRPLIENPPYWDRSYLKKGDGLEKYYERATPAEIADHLRDAISWSQGHASNSPSDTILIYAWNECGEGFGALVPNFRRGQPYGDSSRLDAVGAVLKR
jgi:hypothetical protein